MCGALLVSLTQGKPGAHSRTKIQLEPFSGVLQRLVAPVVGGMVSAIVLTPVVVPGGFLLEKRRRLG